MAPIIMLLLSHPLVLLILSSSLLSHKFFKAHSLFRRVLTTLSLLLPSEGFLVCLPLEVIELVSHTLEGVLTFVIRSGIEGILISLFVSVCGFLVLGSVLCLGLLPRLMGVLKSIEVSLLLSTLPTVISTGLAWKGIIHLSHAVVLLFFVWVAEDRVGIWNFFEFFWSFSSIFIGVIFLRQLVVLFFYFSFRWGLGNTQGLVVVYFGVEIWHSRSRK